MVCASNPRAAWARGACATAALLMSGCGGGSGGDATAVGTEPTEQSQAALSTESVALGLSPFRSSTENTLFFEAEPTLTDGQALAARSGGLLAQWNPRDPTTALAPGAKVAFFGQASGCVDQAANGPTTSGSAADFTVAAARSAVTVPPDLSGLRWTPSADAPACPGAHPDGRGPSAIYIQTGGDAAAVALYTASGPASNGTGAFFQPHGTAGVDGVGTNAHILGSFFGLRRAWWTEGAVHPWRGVAGHSPSTARIASSQHVFAQSLGDGAAGQTVQTKQQMMVEVINVACRQSDSGASGPCLLQFLFNTAVYRSGGSDWPQAQDPSRARIWYDPDQGGIPIVEGHLPEAGRSVVDDASGLSLFTSVGTSTRHGVFGSAGFDVRISFEQALNATRLVTASKLGVPVSQVNDAQQVAVWGKRWQDPGAWTLVQATVGQEVYNPQAATRSAWIGGGFRQLYVASVD